MSAAATFGLVVIAVLMTVMQMQLLQSRRDHAQTHDRFMHERKDLQSQLQEALHMLGMSSLESADIDKALQRVLGIAWQDSIYTTRVQAIADLRRKGRIPHRYATDDGPMPARSAIADESVTIGMAGVSMADLEQLARANDEQDDVHGLRLHDGHSFADEIGEPLHNVPWPDVPDAAPVPVPAVDTLQAQETTINTLHTH